MGLEVTSTLLIVTHRASASHSIFCYFTADPVFWFDLEGFVGNFLFAVLGCSGFFSG